MKKFLLLLGKLLITLVALWPVPMGFIVYYSIGYKYDIPIWGQKAGYWWPLLGVLALGLILCLVSRYKGIGIEKLKSAQFADTFFAPLLKILYWGFLGALAFWALVLLVVLFHFLFLTSAINVSVPVLAGVAILIYLIYLGFKYRNKDSDK